MRAENKKNDYADYNYCLWSGVRSVLWENVQQSNLRRLFIQTDRQTNRQTNSNNNCLKTNTGWRRKPLAIVS